MTRRVVVTGIGVVAPNGRDPETFRRNLEQGVSAVGPIRRFDAGAYPTRIAAEVEDEDEDDRIARFAIEGADQAIADANLAYEDAGVVIAAGMGRYNHSEVFASCTAGAGGGQRAAGGPPPAASRPPLASFDWSAFHHKLLEVRAPEMAARRTPGSIPSLIAARHSLAGPTMSVMTACAAGTQAIGDAARWIRSGHADVVVAGASDSEIYPMGVASFCLLRALSTRNDDPPGASRPFSATRDGFVLGEGAGVLVLEELGRARARGAKLYAEVVGFGSACDSFRVTDPHPDGVGAVLAMTRALAQAKLDPKDVDYLNAHGTSTPLNDRIEAAAVRKVFGDRIAVTSTKSMIGHLTVAAGAVEAIATILSMREQVAHPTINLHDRDPQCDLDVVANEARPMRIDIAISNSFAFGGQCASLILQRIA